MSREILTFQFGHYSNFVGAHWWNLQEQGFNYNPDSPSEINHDVLFREGVTLKGEVTFTPRLLLVDLKGSLKALPEEGELYAPPDQNNPPGNPDVIAEKPEEKIDFQRGLDGAPERSFNLDDDVRVWSDFLYTRFHPRTVNVIREYQHSDDKTPFDIYPLGSNLWKKEQFSEDFVDKIRNYIEECDNFQGFHCLCDSYDGFGGIAASCLEYLRDEYESKSILGFPCINPASKNPLHLLNLALCLDSQSQHCSLYTPLSLQPPPLDYLTYKPRLNYHTSAILASTLDTLTLNYRLKKSHFTLVDLCSAFSTNGRKAAAASIQFPFPLKTDLIECLDSWEGPLGRSVTPYCDINTDNSLQLVVLRGVPENRLKSDKQRHLPAYRCHNVKEMLDYFLTCTCFGARSEVTACGEEMVVKTPFPGFFDSERVSVLAGLHSGTFVGKMFDNVAKDLEGVKYKRFHQFVSEGVENDEFRECFDRLLDLKDCYQDNCLI